MGSPGSNPGSLYARQAPNHYLIALGPNCTLAGKTGQGEASAVGLTGCVKPTAAVVARQVAKLGMG